MPLMHNLGTCRIEDGNCKGRIRSPSALPPLSCKDKCPSSLTPGCREPVQFHRGPPRSFGTCMWYRYPTPNRKHKSAESHTSADRAAGDPGRMSAKPQKHQNEETGCHLGTCLPASQTEISLSRKGNSLQRGQVEVNETPESSTHQPSPSPPATAQANTTH